VSTVFLYTDTNSTLVKEYGSILEGLGGDGDTEDDVLMGVCGDNIDAEATNLSCDLDGSDMFTALSTACAQAGGKVVLHDVSVCGGVMGDLNVTGIESISLESIPLCMATTCADGISLMDILDAGLALIDGIMPAAEGEASLSDTVNAVFDDSCIVISVQGATAGTPTSASVARSSILGAVLAFGITFFAF